MREEIDRLLFASPPVPNHRQDYIDGIYDAVTADRLVVIVGAGVSAEAGIPTAKEIVDGLYRSDLGGLLGQVLPQEGRPRLPEALAAIRSVLGPREFSRHLRKVLSAKDWRWTRPLSPTYELLAHFLYHGRIASVISLNFDEVLDASIELECQGMDPQGSIRVVTSLSDFSALRDELFEADPQATPWVERRTHTYLKPHGTISRYGSLRLERSELAVFEDDKREVLRDYLDGASIVALGWSLGDPDLLEVINATKRTRDPRRVTVVSRSNRLREAIPNSQQFRFLDGGANRFCEFLAKAFETESDLREGRPPSETARGTLRHSIRSELFAKAGDEAPALQPTLDMQVAVEVVMFALKARGHFRPEVLFDCPRTGFLASLLMLHEGTTVASVLDRLQQQPAVLVKVSSKTGGEPSFCLKLQDDEDGSGDVLDSLAWGASRSFLENARRWQTEKGLEPDLDQVRKDYLEQSLASKFKQLTRSFDVDVGWIQRHAVRFTSPRPLTTAQSFREETRRLVEAFGQDGDLELWVSTYTGEWIAERFPEVKSGSERAKKVRVLVDDYRDYPEAYAKGASQRVLRMQQELGVQAVMVPGKIHNMTALVRVGQEGPPVFERAIYFRRESKSTQISPVLLEDGGDLSVLRRLWQRLDQTLEEP